MLMVLGFVGRVSAEGLGVGDPAPKLEVKEFVKGEKVAGFEKGKTYVVEFWATWCGPCRTSIPHLTALQKKYKDAVMIGVSVWERDPSKIKPFVESMGEKMDYRVASDVAIPVKKDKGDGKDEKKDAKEEKDEKDEKSEEDGGKMAKNWMKAADQDGIPTAFIIDGDGVIAWIGHPMEMDKPLAQIVEGKWDMKAAIAAARKQQAVKVALAAVRTKLIKAQQSKDPKAILTALDEAIKDTPELEEQLAPLKFRVLFQQKDATQVLEYGNQMIDGAFKDNVAALNFIAWTIVEKPAEDADKRILKMALRAAQRADQLAEEKRPEIADTLAKAYFENGDPAKALETQERAVKLGVGTPLEKDKEIKERLEQYKKAAMK
ncbi:hypothetical protein FRUB_07347 [Fimbriiglobus ruber]|uniref:Thioredoxin domain-containing protein n=1 Tax=Fimbriiglobus ruber TaxID=1908690 RepID=A0A225DPW8_9BACT|nr:hypothetical protein FRUB_07347 [Fimbriiglobus ruber]